jgi:ABC-2 type transport system permease protein
VRASSTASWTLAAATLAEREVVRFIRQRSRVVAAVATPAIVWAILGAGFAGTVGAAYFFPGAVVLSVVFTSFLAGISLIEDRRDGFLQGVLVSPAPRASVVAGKVAGGAAVAFVHAALFIPLAPVAGGTLAPAGVAAAAGVLAATALGLSGLAFALAWRFESIQGFHGVMNLVLMPMWLLSGAIFPLDGAAVWVRAVAAWNPLAYAVEGLRTTLGL